jgi:hypothetical protein
LSRSKLRRLRRTRERSLLLVLLKSSKSCTGQPSKHVRFTLSIEQRHELGLFTDCCHSTHPLPTISQPDRYVTWNVDPIIGKIEYNRVNKTVRLDVLQLDAVTDLDFILHFNPS